MQKFCCIRRVVVVGELKASKYVCAFHLVFFSVLTFETVSTNSAVLVVLLWVAKVLVYGGFGGLRKSKGFKVKLIIY